MPTPSNPLENPSTYFINPEEAAETSRLLLQDRIITKEMGGVFPASLDLSHIYTVLDLACGPGGWALDVARAYPHIDVVGVDISEKMIRYAQAQARMLGLDNASFQVMDVLKPLAFPQEAFDFVNTRFISPFMPKDAWPRLLQECVRITLPGGVIRLTDGERFGTTLVLSQFLREAGLGNIQHQAYALDYSYGTEAHETMYQNTMITYPLLLPFLLKMGVTTREEFDRLYEQIAAETQEPEYRGLWFYLSVWGTKPVRS